ncbi:MAG: TIGR00299 family protein [Lentisphaerae bacterium GWF2_52_8]|nr:MAG: TIGR00299 family protein [Lentisphaerae bacterium GWF2_52_8]
MKIIQFNSVGGASGDMILGALIGLGADIKALNETLHAILPGEDFSIEACPCESHGMCGIRASVRLARTEGHSHRKLAEIRKIAESAALPEKVRAMTVKTFESLARAEAKIHGTTPEEIHFHEVGALDSIIDITGSCLALHMLGTDATSLTPLPLGHGLIKCAHGTIPSPAPASIELLKGLPTLQVDEPFELVTPSAAALLSTWGNTPIPPGSLIRECSYSFGQRLLKERPNLLRAIAYETPASNESCEWDSCSVLECNIDDSTPEIIGNACSKLMEAGALDVFTCPLQMKKQRPGVLLSVLCREEDRTRMIEMIFRQTSSFGIRVRSTERAILARRHVTASTPFGAVRIKVGSLRGEDISAAPEISDCAKLADEKGLSLRSVWEAAIAASNGLGDSLKK